MSSWNVSLCQPASFCHPVSMSASVILSCKLMPTSKFQSPCQCVSFCHLVRMLSYCQSVRCDPCDSRCSCAVYVCMYARRSCSCRTANSERSTARPSTGSPAARGSTRSSRSRFCPPTGTRGSSCLLGTGTRKRGRNRQSVCVIVQARQREVRTVHAS